MTTKLNLTRLKQNTFKLINIMSFAFFLAACQLKPLDVQSYVADFDTKNYASIAVQSINKDSTFIEMINKGIQEELINKGYSTADEPDIVFVYKLKVNQGEQLRQNTLMDKQSIYNTMTVEAVYEASILINAIETKTKKVIWKASTTRDIRSVNEKNVDQNRINKRMRELLSTFPSK